MGDETLRVPKGARRGRGPAQPGPGDAVELRLLGPVELRLAGVAVDAGQPRQRCVLAALAADAGKPVSVPTLVDRVWGEEPPRRSREALYVYLTGIRKLLQHVDGHTGPSLVRRPGGYLLDLDPDLVDVHRLRRLVGHARDRACPDGRRLTLLRQALGLWRGIPLADLSGDWVSATRQLWEGDYLDAVGRWAEAELRAGDPAAAVKPLTELVELHPLNESLAGGLIRSLHAAGRAADALDCYSRLRARLVQQLGIEPAPEVQQLQQAILRGEIERPQATPASTLEIDVESANFVVPAQLPADIHGFTGRANEMTRLDQLLAASADRWTAVVISTVSGTAGVGKTALAVHWAHQVRDAFPDGQLYVNLRGLDSAGRPPMDPADAIRNLLGALGVVPQRIPLDLDEQIGLYRSLLARKRLLLLLDNAHDAGQVRPLLPGSASVFVIVTSRNQLSSLVAAEGAQPLTLDLFTWTEARQMLSGRIGAHRVAAEKDAVEEIIECCARLPLALAVVTARATIRSGVPLSTLAAELRDSSSRLDALADSESTTNVRIVLSLSYRSLSPGTARLFRLLGLDPGPSISLRAVVHLADLPVGRVRPLLDELVFNHLIKESAPDRYGLHDLMRSYAAEQAHTHDSEAERRSALGRVLDYYVQTAEAADRLLFRYRPRFDSTPIRPAATAEHFAGITDAARWLTDEVETLSRMVETAAQYGLDEHAWRLAWWLHTFFTTQGYTEERQSLLTVALGAAQRLASPRAEAQVLVAMAGARFIRGRHDETGQDIRRALRLFEDLGDLTGQAWTLLGESARLQKLRRYRDSMTPARKALDISRELGDVIRQADALCAIAWAHAHIQEHDAALTQAEHALALQQEADDRARQCTTLECVGYVNHELGRHDAAITAYQRVLELRTERGDRSGSGQTLMYLGDVYRSTGRIQRARQFWQQALEIFDSLHHPDAALLKSRIEQP